MIEDKSCKTCRHSYSDGDKCRIGGCSIDINKLDRPMWSPITIDIDINLLQFIKYCRDYNIDVPNESDTSMIYSLADFSSLPFDKVNKLYTDYFFNNKI